MTGERETGATFVVPRWTPEGAWSRAKAVARSGLDACRGVVLRVGLSPSAAAPELTRCRRIAVLRTDRLGDTVLTFPLVQALKRLAPQAEVLYAVREPWAGLFGDQDHVDGVVALPESPREQARVLGATSPELIIDPRADRNVRSARLCVASQARWRVGFSGSGRERCFTTYRTPPADARHFVDETLAILDVWRDPAPRRLGLPFLRISGRAEQWWDGMSRRHPFLARGYVCLHPGGFFATQRWPEDRFRTLAGRVSRDLGWPVVWVDHGVRLASRSQPSGDAAAPGPFRLSGLSVEQLAAVIGHASLFVGNNTGPLHLASALGVRTMSVMGPTVPERWWPVGPEDVVIRLGLRCSPCNLGWCSHHTCLNGIDVERVFRALRAMLSAPCRDVHA